MIGVQVGDYILILENCNTKYSNDTVKPTVVIIMLKNNWCIFDT